MKRSLRVTEPPPSLSVDLSGRVAFVTGASSGLGRRFAVVLAAAGAAVAVTGRRLERLETLAQEIRGRGGRAAAIQLDVRDAGAIAGAVDRAQESLGLVDILVNNSGVADGQYATKMSLSLVDKVIETNFRAPFLLSCEVARRLMKAGKPGRIVNLSSVGAYHYSADSAATLYCAAKAGVSRLTETLAMEWARFGINVNAIAPGMFHSEMSGAHLEVVGDELRKGMPRKRIGEPFQLDSTLLYLVAPASEFVTGICVRVDDAQYPR
jgi:NAD(P)-dependent dehydrogenase (short-subunit alcohol dehydrogenase family)